MQQVNNSGDNITIKRLALTKIVKVSLNEHDSSDEGIVYSPAYITTTNSATDAPGVRFKLLSMFGKFLLNILPIHFLPIKHNTPTHLLHYSL